MLQRFKRNRIYPIVIKEFIHIIRDRRTLLIVFIMPVILLLLYGFALTFDVKNIPTVVMDRDNTPLSRDLIDGFKGSAYFHIISYADSFKDENKYFLEGKAKAAINIDHGFSGLVRAGKPAQIQVVVDGADANTALISIGYISAITQGFSQNVIIKAFSKIAGGNVSADLLPIEAKPRIWYNPRLESMRFLVPGIIAIILMVLAAMIISTTVVSEKDHGTLEQLIATPIKPIEIMLGKMIPYIIVGFGDVLLCALTALFVFGVGIKGSVILFFIESVIFICGVLGLGLFISAISQKQIDAIMISAFATMLPSLLLSGFIFPINNMPAVIQWITYFVPARYFINIMRGIYLKGIGIDFLWWDTLLLSLFAALMLFLASKNFKKRLE